MHTIHIKNVQFGNLSSKLQKESPLILTERGNCTVVELKNSFYCGSVVA